MKVLIFGSAEDRIRLIGETKEERRVLEGLCQKGARVGIVSYDVIDIIPKGFEPRITHTPALYKPIDKLFKRPTEEKREHTCVYCEEMIASGGPYYYCTISEDIDWAIDWARNPCLAKDWMRCPLNKRSK